MPASNPSFINDGNAAMAAVAKINPGVAKLSELQALSILARGLHFRKNLKRKQKTRIQNVNAPAAEHPIGHRNRIHNACD